MSEILPQMNGAWRWCHLECAGALPWDDQYVTGDSFTAAIAAAYEQYQKEKNDGAEG